MAFTAAGVIGLPARAAIAVSPEEARAIAKEAYIYGFPMVDYYRIMWSYFVNKGGKEYKGPPNGLYSEANVFTPADTAVQTPNSDTPYSFALVGSARRTGCSDLAEDRSRSLLFGPAGRFLHL